MICSRCKTNEAVYKDKRPGKNNGICRECHTAKMKKYRTTDNGKAAIKKAVTKYEQANPNRRKAWSAASDIQKKECEVCGDENVHRHHADPLNKLDVVFLCPLHHKEAHKKLLMNV